MAELVVSQVVLQISNLLLEKVFGMLDIHRELTEIKEHLLDLSYTVVSSSKQQHDAAAKAWLHEIRDVANDLSDLLGILPENYRFSLSPKKVIARLKLRKELKNVLKKLKFLKNKWNRQLNVSDNNLPLSITEGSLKKQRSMTGASIDGTIVGLEEDKLTIVSLLCQPVKHREAISIVGMGGVGKTTLALEVYNDIEIQKLFPTRAWVTVSAFPSITDILRQIKTQVSSQPSDRNIQSESQEDLVGEVKRLLSEQGRYLIVMDDVWSTELWDEMQTAIPDVQDGSRVIFTTRSQAVAKHANPTTYHLMGALNEENSLKLLFRIAHPDQAIEEVPEELREIGKKLAGTCQGVPLTLVLVASFLKYKEYSPSAWDEVFEALQRDDYDYGPKILVSLNLSYNYLPSEWKPCFVYIGIFPFGYHISVRRLIRLWRAERLIQQELDKSMEETAYMILEQLIQRCFVEVVDYRYNGTVKSIKIHDLLRDFCIYKARDALFFSVLPLCEDNSLISLSFNECHFPAENIDDRECIGPSSENSKNKKFHSFLGFNSSLKFDISLHSNYFHPKLLRVIDIEGISKIYELPKEITSMSSLRYLRWIVATNGIIYFPSSIKKMFNLETLDIHPQVTGPDKDMDGIGVLKNLHTLKRIIAGKWIMRDLANLTNLSKLRIHDLTADSMEVLVNLLKKLRLLVSLTLQSSEKIPTKVLTVFKDGHPLHVLKLLGELTEKQLPDSKEFPAHLDKLVLLGSMLENDPMESLGKVQSLKLIKFGRDAYKGRKMTCSSDGFPNLQHLIFEELKNFEEWEVKDGGIPKLTHLSIYYCMHSERIVKGLESRTKMVINIIPTAAYRRIKEDEEEPSAGISSSSYPSLSN
ncbi:disease resistance protein RPP13-like [Typha latifolia]|uniref:disease resistance protein RPP13-like n=1 Tax=Typha latifolia TaxID=4733 RepID=UPI003C2DAA85